MFERFKDAEAIIFDMGADIPTEPRGRFRATDQYQRGNSCR